MWTHSHPLSLLTLSRLSHGATVRDYRRSQIHWRFNVLGSVLVSGTLSFSVCVTCLQGQLLCHDSFSSWLSVKKEPLNLSFSSYLRSSVTNFIRIMWSQEGKSRVMFFYPWFSISPLEAAMFLLLFGGHTWTSTSEKGLGDEGFVVGPRELQWAGMLQPSHDLHGYNIRLQFTWFSWRGSVWGPRPLELWRTLSTNSLHRGWTCIVCVSTNLRGSKVRANFARQSSRIRFQSSTNSASSLRVRENLRIQS